MAAAITWRRGVGMGEILRRLLTSSETVSRDADFDSSQAECKDVRAACNGDVLIAVDGIRHRTRSPTLVGVELPEPFSVAGIGCDEALVCSVENQPAGSGHEAAAENAASYLNLPRRFSRLDVERFERSPACARARHPTRDTAVERLAGFPLLIVLRVDRARFFREQIKEASHRAEGRRRPVRRARDCGTGALPFTRPLNVGHQPRPAVATDSARPV